MSEDGLTVKTQMTRGTSSDDKEKITVEVSAENVDELDDKMSRVRKQLEQWAEDVRNIQPEQRRDRDDDQRDLTEVTP